MFVKRDQNGKITAVSQQQDAEFAEAVNSDSAELTDFFTANNTDNPVRSFRRSDADLIRVLEDLVDLLTEKGIIQFTDLPEPAQQKLIARQSLRRNIKKLDLVSDDPDEETIFIR